VFHKTNQNYFCHTFVKFPQTLIIFSKKIASSLKLQGALIFHLTLHPFSFLRHSVVSLISNSFHGCEAYHNNISTMKYYNTTHRLLSGCIMCHNRTKVWVKLWNKTVKTLWEIIYCNQFGQ